MQLIKLLLIFLITRTAFAWTAPLPYLMVDHEFNRVGMFSVFSYVAGVLHNYDRHEYAGLEVRFGENSPYYDADYGANWWEYYCEPIRLGSRENAYIKKTNVRYGKYASITERHLSRFQVYELIQKYIKIKEPILEKVKEFTLENFDGFHIIAIHYRGTDKITEAPRISYDEVISRVNKYVTRFNLENYRIFIASDELEFIQCLQNTFPGLVLTYSTLHAVNGEPLHHVNSNPYLQGEEALIDCLLLAQGNVLIRTSSNLSRWSTFFNPTIPCIELNEKYGKFDMRKKRNPHLTIKKPLQKSLGIN